MKKSVYRGFIHIIVLFIIIVLLVTVITFVLLTKNKTLVSAILPNMGLSTPSPTPFTQSTDTKNKMMTWQGLTIFYAPGSFNSEGRISLSSMGNLTSPEFDDVSRFELEVYPNGDSKSFKLLKPLTLEFNLGDPEFKNIVQSCGYDINTLSFYSDQSTGNDFFNGESVPEKINSTIDSGKNILSAKLTHLGKYQQYGIFTDIIVGAKPTKYLLGCGDGSNAWLDEKYLVFKLEKYKVLLPEGFKRPVVSEGLVNNRVTFYSQTASNPSLELLTQSNWQKLTTIKLNKLRYPSYEMSPDSDFFEGEKIDSSQILTFGQKDFLEVKSASSNSAVYRLMTTYDVGNSVFVIEFKLDKNSMNLYDSYKTIVSDLASSFSEYK